MTRVPEERSVMVVHGAARDPPQSSRHRLVLTATDAGRSSWAGVEASALHERSQRSDSGHE